MGWRSSDTHPLFFDDVRVPADARLSEPGRGYRDALEFLTWARLPVAVISLISDVHGDGIETEVNGLVEHEIGGYARLARVYVTKALPKTRWGKIMRRLRDVIVDGRPGGDMSALEDASALEAVTSVVASTITRQVT